MSKIAKEEISDISPVLFLDISGHPMRFYLRPGPTKMQLYPLITNGGGIMCRNQEPGAILLVDPVDVTNAMANTGQTYISTQFIRDCVKQNQQLDIDGYTISIGPSVQTRMASRNQSNGRLCYSQDDDAAILKFMEKRRHEAKGILVWREMEKQRVTDHSWQSMKNRFLKHLQYKLLEKSPEKCPGTTSKKKPLTFSDSSSCEEGITQTSSKTGTPQKSPRKSVVISDAAETQSATETSLCPTLSTNPSTSPERASLPPDVAEAAGEPSQASSNDGEQESCVQIHELDKMIKNTQEQPRPVNEGPEMSKRPRLDEDCDGQDIPDGSNENSSSLNETRQTTSKSSTPTSKKLGILARAAREFEDSDVMDDESEEDEGPSEAPLIKSSDTQGSLATPENLAREPESQAEHHKAQQHSPESLCNGATPIPADEGSGPSSTAVPITLSGHNFIFESQEDHSKSVQEETFSRDLLEVKQHVMNLIAETKKDLVEVTKALFKANGDLTKAQMYLLEGYDREMHGPLWTRLDDELLLLADPNELKQLQSKYGEGEVNRRKAFLKTTVN
ncbi:telomeric repeat-binding factor 2-interacting protein 1-like [Myxocyprinus asiaticus]|uniref:telomeric repeat-binding factor 2-interacting protein 1-like n=1 Tax=Myxocyprinus asiaticus TaxID=70543 RepID=UPI002222494E|nr:telomeric repeat-binding factor 2-interacting protein 1-like [Myxocyprinus asiaticus]